MDGNRERLNEVNNRRFIKGLGEGIGNGGRSGLR